MAKTKKSDKKDLARRILSTAQSIDWRVKKGKDKDAVPFIIGMKELVDQLENSLDIPPEPIKADISFDGLRGLAHGHAMDVVDTWGETIRAVGWPGYNFGKDEGPEWSDDHNIVTFHCEFEDEASLHQAEDELRTEGYNRMKVEVKS